ncbi:MAG: tetratricopeptide repeat protein [Ignavibacteriales bacterium]|nr:tetratricopeptide repeat protein [Ignavibacteriales bacterium]
MIKKILPVILFAFSLFAQQSPMDQNQFMLAQSYEQQGDFNKAVEIIETLNKKDPSNIQYFNKLNTLYLQLKKYDESAAIINSRIISNPQDVSLYGLLGSTYYTAGDRTKAYQVWDDATEKFKTNPITFRIIANFAIERRDFEKAIELLNQGKKFSKDAFLYSYDLGELYNITMRYREAAEEYCDLIKANPSQYPQIENKILSYSNKPNALDETIEVIEKYKSDNISFRYLLARLYIEKKNYDEAFNLYKEIDKKQNTNGADIYSFGEFVYRDGEYKTASDVFKFLLDNYSDQQYTPLAKLGYAKTQEALLIQKYNEANPEWKTFYTPAKVEAKEIEPVINAYQDIVKVYQHSEAAIEAMLRIGILYSHYRGDVVEAENYFKIVIKDYPTSKFASLAFIELGNIKMQQAKLDEAEKLFQLVSNLVRINSEDKSFAMYQIARINSFKNDFESARKDLTTVMNNLKDNVANDAIEFSILLNTAKNDSSNLSLYCSAEFLAEQKRFGEAKDLYLQLSQNPQAFVFSSIAKLRTAEMLIAIDDYPNAIANLTLIVDEAEKNIYADKALYLQGQIYQYGLKDDVKAVESYESLLAKFPKSLYLDEARKNIIELKKKIS